jgi:hypothetical protein
VGKQQTRLLRLVSYAVSEKRSAAKHPPIARARYFPEPDSRRRWPIEIAERYRIRRTEQKALVQLQHEVAVARPPLPIGQHRAIAIADSQTGTVPEPDAARKYWARTQTNLGDIIDGTVVVSTIDDPVDAVVE